MKTDDKKIWKIIIISLVYSVVIVSIRYFVFYFPQQIFAMIGTTFVALLVIIIYVVMPAIEESYEYTPPGYQSFLEKLEKAATTRELTWVQIQIMAEADTIPRETIGRALRTMLSSAYQDEKANMQLITNLENNLNSFKNDEPFDQIPQDIKIYLERLRDKLEIQDVTLLEPLANKLRELNDINSREKKTERLKSTLGILIGILGIIAGSIGIILTLLNPQ